MSKGNTFINDILNLIFNATPIANIADNAATAPLTSLYVSLHTASPGAAGNQTTSEAAYTGYARVAVARTTGGWSASTVQSTSPVASITFGTATAGSETETYWQAFDIRNVVPERDDNSRDHAVVDDSNNYIRGMRWLIKLGSFRQPCRMRHVLRSTAE
jgi:hypothetical protein